MTYFTPDLRSPQPFRAMLEKVMCDIINSAEEYAEREWRIECALEEGAISPETAYALRSGDL